MRVAYIVPGSGNTFYCQNCLRDLTLVRALRRAGHDVLLVPMYLPLFDDDGAPQPSAPVFYGAIRIYLEQRWPWLSKAPAWAGRLLDAAPLLRLAARKAGSTRAHGLEEMTLSMLRGEAGQQAAELDRLIGWLDQAGFRPDVVHISNSLLLGLAGAIKRRLNAPIVCSLQDEDTWVDAMQADKAREIWSLMAEKARGVDAFTAVSRHYADAMRRQLGFPPERSHVVPVGVDLEGHQPAPLTFDPPVIGFLSRLARSEGFGLLAEAFVLLKADVRFKSVKLAATGGHTGDDHRLLREIRRRLRRQGVEGDLLVTAEFDRPRRLAFLQSLSVLSVPVLKGDACGAYLLEAMASGIPCVQPRLAAFPEILDATGGGVLYDRNEPATLAEALTALLLNPARARQLGTQGRAAVLQRFGADQVAGQLAGVYESLARARARDRQ